MYIVSRGLSIPEINSAASLVKIYKNVFFFLIFGDYSMEINWA
jgi:hypothetical protein